MATEHRDLDGAATLLDAHTRITSGSSPLPRDGQMMATVAVLGAASGANDSA